MDTPHKVSDKLCEYVINREKYFEILEYKMFLKYLVELKMRQGHMGYGNSGYGVLISFIQN